MKPFCKLRAFAFLAFTLTSFSHAILDLNNNGMSDPWEEQHNNGTLFDTSFVPTSDPDQDGWDNATEAVAGTDPFEPNPPDGIVVTQLEPSLTQGSYTLTWPTIFGKRYRLQASYDLDTWVSVGNSHYATATSLSIGISAVQPDTSVPPKIFWRIIVSDFDADNDGLTNSEEFVFGTDGNNADSDGDGLEDLVEILLSLNPNDPDSDGDGSTDSQERNAGSNPNSNLSHPVVWKSITRMLVYEFTDYQISQGGKQGQIDTSGFWNQAQSYTSHLFEEIPWTSLDNELSSHTPFPSSMPADFNVNDFTSKGQAEYMINPPCHHVDLTQQRFWLDVRPALTYDISKKAVLVTERIINTIESAVTTQVVEASISAGSNTSDPIALKPGFISVPTLNLPQKENVKMTLLPMEVYCDELYTFFGHKNDKVDLCYVDGVNCVWRLKNLTPNIGGFSNSYDSKCSFIPVAPGKNTIQLLIDDVVVWEKDTEVIDIVARADWGAVPSKTHSQTIPDIQHVTLHHTSNVATGAAEMGQGFKICI
jgi:hypothetical protein